MIKWLKENHPAVWKVWEKFGQENKEKTVWVGGGVRDYLLGLEPKDFDLATSLTPEKVLEIAKKNQWSAIEVGAAFGVVIVICEGIGIEVATFRKEGYGKDPHRPEWVKYGVSLEEDLGRRDFTINGIAIELSGEVIDPFDGIQDLNQKSIRAIGDPEMRIQEDFLRMLRAVRFASRLDFDLEEKTAAAIRVQSGQIVQLSQERIRDELEKILIAPYASKGWELLESLQLGPKLFPKSWKERKSGEPLNRLPATPVFRWAFLGWALSPEALRWKGMKKELRQYGTWLAQEAEAEWEGIETVAQWVQQGAFKNPCTLAEKIKAWQIFRKTLYPTKRNPSVEQIEKTLDKVPFFSSQLKIPGELILEFIPPGPEISQAQKEMLKQIQKGQLKNSPKELMEWLERQYT